MLNKVKNIIGDLAVVLKYPVLLGLLMFDMAVLLPSTFLVGYHFGTVSAVAFFTLTQSPIEYLIIKEIRRLNRLLPMSEAFETSPEKWNMALQEYVSKVKNNQSES
ncbi:MAG: hypothetical protein ACPLW8_05205 [Candidatus Bathyarchaeales archaeon]